MAITDWPINERPREKLLHKGADALSDAELLAIVLRTGSQGKSAVDLARHLIKEFNGLRPLLCADQATLCLHAGIGPATYAQLQSIRYLGQRFLLEQVQQNPLFSSPDATRQYLLSKLRDHQHEEFHILYLDTQYQLLHDEMLFRGTIASAAVYPREVVKGALSANAAAVILVHNHPSGIAEPSQADLQITQKLIQALSLVDIQVLDHQIVGNNRVVSMAERGLITVTY